MMTAMMSIQFTRTMYTSMKYYLIYFWLYSNKIDFAIIVFQRTDGDVQSIFSGKNEIET